MSIICQKCGARKFKGETKGFCCSDGIIQLPPFQAPPTLFQELYEGESRKSKAFLENIRQYNNSFCMTSFGADIAAVHGWNPSFRIQGQIHHRIGSVLPENRTQAKFLNVYFLGSVESEVTARRYGDLDREITREITKC